MGSEPDATDPLARRSEVATPREEAIRLAVIAQLARNDPDDPRIRMLAAVVLRVLLAEGEER
ncbi:hypothetical protein [Methyloversatilis sp.]|uniref:hypothetical protein n=1 Tax=Methyloversatilis sp. TaxID=2569862 RepID=UPI0035B12217